jgi:hypothetical protein
MTIDLDKLEELAKAATPGPWIGDRIDGTVKYDIVAGDYPNGEFEIVCRGNNGNNFGFMKREDEDYTLAANPTAILELIAEVRNLRETIRKQASSARAGMDAAKRAATILYAEADKARAESSPDVLASERQANAMLTEENERLRDENSLCREAIEDAVDMVDACAATYDDDGSQGALRATKRQLSEAIGKACPRLLMEKPDGQKFYGLQWRELRAEVTRLRERLEIDPRHGYDGIYSRDETIRLQDERIDALRWENEALWKDAYHYRRLKTFAHPSYNVAQGEKILTVRFHSWSEFDAMLDGVVVVNTVNVREQA